MHYVINIISKHFNFIALLEIKYEMYFCMCYRKRIRRESQQKKNKEIKAFCVLSVIELFSCQTFFSYHIDKKILFFHFFLLTRQIKVENFAMCMMMIAKDSFIQKVFFSLVFYFSRHTFKQFSSYFYFTQNFTHIHPVLTCFFFLLILKEKSCSPFEVSFRMLLG